MQLTVYIHVPTEQKILFKSIDNLMLKEKRCGSNKCLHIFNDNNCMSRFISFISKTCGVRVHYVCQIFRLHYVTLSFISFVKGMPLNSNKLKNNNR